MSCHLKTDVRPVLLSLLSTSVNQFLRFDCFCRVWLIVITQGGIYQGHEVYRNVHVRIVPDRKVDDPSPVITLVVQGPESDPGSEFLFYHYRYIEEG